MQIKIKGIVVAGHGVASGKGNDPRYPDGTLALQKPYFAKSGLNLDEFYQGTINVNIAPATFVIKKGKYFFKHIAWSDHIAPENFYFFEVTVLINHERYDGLIYMPDPATKTDHMQDPSVLEIMLQQKVDAIKPGLPLFLEIDDEQLDISQTSN
jgi:hypothetical protein